MGGVEKGGGWGGAGQVVEAERAVGGETRKAKRKKKCSGSGRCAALRCTGNSGQCTSFGLFASFAGYCNSSSFKSAFFWVVFGACASSPPFKQGSLLLPLLPVLLPLPLPGPSSLLVVCVVCGVAVVAVRDLWRRHHCTFSRSVSASHKIWQQFRFSVLSAPHVRLLSHQRRPPTAHNMHTPFSTPHSPTCVYTMNWNHKFVSQRGSTAVLAPPTAESGLLVRRSSDASISALALH